VALISERTIPVEHRRLLAKLVSTFTDRQYFVVSTTDLHGRILGFLDRSRYLLLQVPPQLYSRGWVDPVPDPLLLRLYYSAGNRIWNLWICSQEIWPSVARNSDHETTEAVQNVDSSITYWLMGFSYYMVLWIQCANNPIVILTSIIRRRYTWVGTASVV
jgi:hypothetical protein